MFQLAKRVEKRFLAAVAVLVTVQFVSDSGQCVGQERKDTVASSAVSKPLPPTDAFPSDYSLYGLFSREVGELAPGSVGQMVGGTADVRGPGESITRKTALVMQNAVNDVAPWISELAEAVNPSPGSPGLNSVLGRDDRRRITDTTTFPYRTICKLKITYPNGETRGGTGFLVSRRTVLTAGHCVHSRGRGGWATRIEVIPGMNGSSSAPFGSVTVGSSALISNTAWVNGTDDDKDYGAIVLPDSTLGNKTGTLGFEVFRGIINPTTFFVGGYPTDKPSGTSWFASGSVKFVDADKILHNIDTAGGQSGAPLWFIRDGVRFAIGIHVAGYNDSLNQATKINTTVFDFIKRRP